MGQIHDGPSGDDQLPRDFDLEKRSLAIVEKALRRYEEYHMKPREKALEIGTLILEQQELPEFDLEILRDALELALEVWYDRDAENYEILAVEELIDSRPVTNSPLKGWYGTIDLSLKDKYSNDVKIIDWKTTSGQLDKT